MDTQFFYTDAEMEVHKEMTMLMAESTKKRKEAMLLQHYWGGQCTEKSAIKQLRKLYQKDDFTMDEAEVKIPPEESIQALYAEVRATNAEVRAFKDKLKQLQRNYTGIRTLRADQLTNKTIISIFESSLTRTIKMRTDELSDALIIVKVFFFDVFESIVNNGFLHNGEKYICLTASAGQIRTKKCVFIKESLFLEYHNTLMCGLSVEEINRRGGCNTNKYLAYLALFNSATDPWYEFDIDKAIVVEDMETVVSGLVDYIDDQTYKIERKVMDIPICHTDGCGMILPGLTGGKNTMIRLPWVKGLLASFPFDTFVAEASEKDGWNYGVVTDIYGKTHDVLAEGIQVIFTKSQFKMWKYYDSWEQYKEYFKKFGCEAGLCNMEDDIIDNATVNYQILQSLTDLTDDELRELAGFTNYQLNHLARDTKVQLKVLGATQSNTNRSAEQESLLLYPELLQDAYFKNELREIKRSYTKQAKAGKLGLYAKYLFVVPDLYAYCEWLFLGDKNPKGLLADGEVYTELFSTVEKLDCLRSPHLYREHPVRKNVRACGADYSKWFSKRGIYTSCCDLISRVLQFDNDGDKLLVCADKTLVAAAERNMEGIVPLYYKMGKAAAKPICNSNIYAGMSRAYSCGNIGPISNNITKIWNNPDPDIDVVKILTAGTNWTIDSAKTLYMPTPPREVKHRIAKATNRQVPHFFIYAKDKEAHQVEDINESCVNRLEHIVTKKHIAFTDKSSGGGSGTFNYTMLMNNPLLIPTKNVEDIGDYYVSLMRGLRFWEKPTDEDADYYSYQYKLVKDKMLAFAPEAGEAYIVDAVIHKIFGITKSAKKKVFWGAFGDVALNNLRRNLEAQCSNMLICLHCESRFVPNDQWSTCPRCNKKNSKLKAVECEDCGGTFYIDPKYTGLQKKCRICYSIHRNKIKLEHKRRTDAGKMPLVDKKLATG